MKISRLILKTADALISFIIVLALIIAGVYASYALWDNNRVYASAGDVQDDMIKLKPKIDEDESGPSFEDLLAVNSDVRAWVSLDGTEIDYPILQGNTNLSYINTDVYGNFALAGSIFLDSRNDASFHDTYSLLYGHSMENSRMFGDLNLYKEESFFRENQTGTLILPNKVYNLRIIACLIVPSSEDSIFVPDQWQGDIVELLSFTENNALYLNNDVIKDMKSVNEAPQLLSFTTCSSEFTDARTVILAVMKPSSTSN